MYICLYSNFQDTQDTQEQKIRSNVKISDFQKQKTYWMFSSFSSYKNAENQNKIEFGTISIVTKELECSCFIVYLCQVPYY